MSSVSRSSTPDTIILDLTNDDCSNDEVTFRFVSWNVWFDSFEQVRRIEELLRIIKSKSPDVIAFQEMTPHIYQHIIHNVDWLSTWHRCGPPESSLPSYFCTIFSRLPIEKRAYFPFEGSVMQRGLVVSGVVVDGVRLTVGTTHLESPMRTEPNMFSDWRRVQLEETQRKLSATRNCIVGGDFNWISRDGAMDLNPRWMDAWSHICRRRGDYVDPDSCATYDGTKNRMTPSGLKNRLDRFICKLEDFEIDSMQLLGTEAFHESVWQEALPLSELKVVELKEMCERYRVPKSGTKSVLVDRLTEAGAPKKITRERRRQVYPSDHWGICISLKKVTNVD
eukprot:Rmarinus@m.14495